MQEYEQYSVFPYDMNKNNIASRMQPQKKSQAEKTVRALPNEPQPNAPEPQPQKSSYLQKYFKILPKSLINGNRQPPNPQSTPFIKTSHFNPSMTMLTQYTNFQQSRILLHYGFYKLTIQVLYLLVGEQLFGTCDGNQGAFGVVYGVGFMGKVYAVKTIKRQKNYNNDNVLRNICKQYFMCKFADTLGIAPKMPKLFSYDILITKTHAIFAMQFCSRCHINDLSIKLKQNLSFMHTYNLIHADIKPANVAYSAGQGRNVFIDFGLGKFVKEGLGYKTESSFVGTLAYCSQQMRKLCGLTQRKPVDLYYNDAFGLKKTINQLQSSNKHQQLQLQAQLSNSLFQQQQPVAYLLEYPSTNLILQSLIPLLMLKNSLFNNDLKRIVDLLVSDKYNFKKLGICVGLVLGEKGRAVRELADSLNKHLALLESKEGFENSNTKMYAIFNHDISQYINEFMSINQIVELPMDQFVKYIQNTGRLHKIFIYLNPLNRQPPTTEQSLTISLLKKLSQSYPNLNLPAQLPQAQQLFFAQKVRTVLIIFYQKLKDLKNVGILLDLRMLFIAVEDWVYVQTIQQILINSSKDKGENQGDSEETLRVLRMVEFSGFWKIVLDGSEGANLPKWKLQIQQLYKRSILPAQQNKQSHIRKQILEISIKLININMQQDKTIDSQSLMASIQNLLKTQNLSPAHIQTLTTIKYLYSQHLHLPVAYIEIPTPLPLALEIYTQHFTYLKKDINLSEINTKIRNFQMLQSIHSQYKNSYNREYGGKKYQLAVSTPVLLDYVFHVFRGRYQLLGARFWLSLYNSTNNCQEFFYYIVDYMLVYINNIQHANRQQLNGIYVFIACIFNLIDQNRSAGIAHSKLSIKQTKQLNYKLQHMYKKAQQKQPSEIPAQPWLRPILTVIQIQLSIFYRKPKQYFIAQLQKLTQQISQLQYIRFSLFKTIILCLQHLNWLKEWKIYLKGITDFMKFMGRMHVDRDRFQFFQRSQQYFGIVIKIQMRSGRYREVVGLILRYMQYGHKKYSRFRDRFYYLSLFHVTSTLCKILPKPKLLQLYNQLRSKYKTRQFQCPFYAHFLFKIFTTIENELERGLRVKQLVRSMVCSQWMVNRSLIQFRLQFYRLAREYQLVSNFRKNLILSKTQGKLQKLKKSEYYQYIFKKNKLKLPQRVYHKLRHRVTKMVQNQQKNSN